MTQLSCTHCGTPLTGGLDTFGEIDAPMCQKHFFAHPPPTEDDLRIAELNDELDGIYDEIEDLEEQLSDLRNQEWKLQDELKLYQPVQKPTKVVLKLGYAP
jgi:uncharacterized Zn finger protein (UPF0148 family)